MSIETVPALRMIDAILEHVETFFQEAGCPLTSEQVAALLTARDSASERESVLARGGR